MRNVEEKGSRKVERKMLRRNWLKSKGVKLGKSSCNGIPKISIHSVALPRNKNYI